MIGFALLYLSYFLSLFVVPYLADLLFSIEYLRNFEFGEICSPVLSTFEEAQQTAQQELPENDEQRIPTSSAQVYYHDEPEEELYEGYEVDFQVHMVRPYEPSPTPSPSSSPPPRPGPSFSACALPSSVVPRTSSRKIKERLGSPIDMGASIYSVSVLPGAPPSPSKERFEQIPAVCSCPSPQFIPSPTHQQSPQREHRKEAAATLSPPIVKRQSSIEQSALDTPGPSRIRRSDHPSPHEQSRYRSPTPPLQAILNCYNESSSRQSSPDPDSPPPTRPSAKALGKRRAVNQNEGYETDRSSKRTRSSSSSSSDVHVFYAGPALAPSTPLTPISLTPLEPPSPPSLLDRSDSVSRRPTCPPEGRSYGSRKRRRTGIRTEVLLCMVEEIPEEVSTPPRNSRTPPLSVSPADTDATVLATPPEPEAERNRVHVQVSSPLRSERSGSPSPSPSGTQSELGSSSLRRRVNPPAPLVLDTPLTNNTLASDNTMVTSSLQAISTQMIRHGTSQRVHRPQSLIASGLLDTTSPTTSMFQHGPEDDHDDLDSVMDGEPRVLRESHRVRKHNKLRRRLASVQFFFTMTACGFPSSPQHAYLQRQRFNLMPEIGKAMDKIPIRLDQVNYFPPPLSPPDTPELPIEDSPLTEGLPGAKRATDLANEPAHWRTWPRPIVRRDISTNNYTFEEMRSMNEDEKVDAAHAIHCKQVLKLKMCERVMAKYQQRVVRLRRGISGPGEASEEQLFDLALQASLSQMMGGRISRQERKLRQAEADLAKVEATTRYNIEHSSPLRNRRTVCKTYLADFSAMVGQAVFQTWRPGSMPSRDEVPIINTPHGQYVPLPQHDYPAIFVQPPSTAASASEQGAVPSQNDPNLLSPFRPMPQPIPSIEEVTTLADAQNPDDDDDDDGDDHEDEDSEGSVDTGDISSEEGELADIPDEGGAEARAAGAAELDEERPMASKRSPRPRYSESYERALIHVGPAPTEILPEEDLSVREDDVLRSHSSLDDQHGQSEECHEGDQLESPVSPSAQHTEKNERETVQAEDEAAEEEHIKGITGEAVAEGEEPSSETPPDTGGSGTIEAVATEEQISLAEAASMDVTPTIVEPPRFAFSFVFPLASQSNGSTTNTGSNGFSNFPVESNTLTLAAGIGKSLPTTEFGFPHPVQPASENSISPVSHAPTSTPAPPSSSSSGSSSRPAPVTSGPTNAFERAIKRSRTLSTPSATARGRGRGRGAARGGLGRLWESHIRQINPAPLSVVVDGADQGGELERQLTVALQEDRQPQTMTTQEAKSEQQGGERVLDTSFAPDAEGSSQLVHSVSTAEIRHPSTDASTHMPTSLSQTGPMSHSAIPGSSLSQGGPQISSTTAHHTPVQPHSVEVDMDIDCQEQGDSKKINLSSSPSQWPVHWPLSASYSHDRLFPTISLFGQTAQDQYQGRESTTTYNEEINMLEPEGTVKEPDPTTFLPKRASNPMWGASAPIVDIGPIRSDGAMTQRTSEVAVSQEIEIDDSTFEPVIALHVHVPRKPVPTSFMSQSVMQQEFSSNAQHVASPPDFVMGGSPSPPFLLPPPPPYTPVDTLQAPITPNGLTDQSFDEVHAHPSSAISPRKGYQFRDVVGYDADLEQEEEEGDEMEEVEIPYRNPVKADVIVEGLLALSISGLRNVALHVDTPAPPPLTLAEPIVPTIAITSPVPSPVQANTPGVPIDVPFNLTVISPPTSISPQDRGLDPSRLNRSGIQRRGAGSNTLSTIGEEQGESVNVSEERFTWEEKGKEKELELPPTTDEPWKDYERFINEVTSGSLPSWYTPSTEFDTSKVPEMEETIADDHLSVSYPDVDGSRFSAPAEHPTSASAARTGGTGSDTTAASCHPSS
ncbi:uncharacterized protein I303_100188 [Kwoniella dejecticola CBS 10117]|uniref:Uncharacterized protein n=1 Tax=Kwoniella dejecticola CBS 10117 TaxID=1296121 RepID=A0A1A6AE85_9TREE|nr:uncharacterized protein I303_00190 [Kwoniella dejecticola CBS 10117]OBR88375.1 hypothetical protein I303_00190 [Kwoniella dejecticola CBS 10117]